MRRSSPHPLGCDKSAAQTMQPQALAPQALRQERLAATSAAQTQAQPQAFVVPGSGGTT